MIDKTTRYLIDTNMLIRASNEFYHPDRSITFWNELAVHVREGRICVLKIVSNELIWKTMRSEQAERERFISKWSRTNVEPYAYDEHSDQQIFDSLQLVAEFIKHGPYKSKAKRQWDNTEKVADPWIIAAAIANPQCTVVTDEVTQGPLAGTDQLNELKIPFVCDHFQVPYTRSIYDVMQDLDIVADQAVRDFGSVIL
ncbi:MAG: DUF4411 family protein [Clostridia bacterium]|nr:DUF4411 family protein [Clostridia bacterium]